MRGTATDTVIQLLFYPRITSHVGLDVGCAHQAKWTEKEQSERVSTLTENVHIKTKWSPE